MVEIEKLINARVMVVLTNRDGLGKIGITENNFYAKIVGYDRIGLWIENPEFTTTRVRDDNGNIIPPELRKQEQYLANVLIPWANVRSIVQFPEREGFSYEEDGIGSLGHGVYL
ncbi:hypothetical protein CSB45_07950 [candidate division KSB3 bacterium]|uniref:Uncharacterized protein n=1 Tax=candidate division KSB3 bacterium TaxID=2044937 RepID=A0A2G6E4Z5_9BACT|nr:MAG: hypothetical protein CSB45_07950 [candidate division KSB3 bacterium]PIE28359.1 MAG: hypothetical protein CSA57_14260 [candidate division KSB3 bacterium]